MVSDEFVASAKEWHDKRLTYFDFFRSLPEETRVRAVTLFCLHKDCNMKTVELLFRAYTGEFDYLLTEKAMPILPSREAYFESRRETRGLVEEMEYANLYQCPQCEGPVRRLNSVILTPLPPQYIYRCYECGYEERHT